MFGTNLPAPVLLKDAREVIGGGGPGAGGASPFRLPKLQQTGRFEKVRKKVLLSFCVFFLCFCVSLYGCCVLFGVYAHLFVFCSVLFAFLQISAFHQYWNFMTPVVTLFEGESEIAECGHTLPEYAGTWVGIL